MMYDIITVGSATKDVFVRTEHPKIVQLHGEHDILYPIGTKLLIEGMTCDIGGGGTNTAVGFSRFGMKTAYAGVVGDDENGASILQVLKKEGVRFIGKRKRGVSGYSVILIGVEKDRTILTFKGVNNLLRWNDICANILKTKFLYFSSMVGGSYNTLIKIASAARRKHIKYAFNPSSYLTKKGLSFLKPIISGCYILILNKEEASLLIKKRGVNQLLKSLQKYTSIVVITDGKKGAYAYDGRCKYTIVPRAVHLVDTTGAGDAFATGFIAAMIEKSDISHALHIGLEESQSVIRSIGAKKGLLRRRKAELLVKKHNVSIVTKKI